MQLTAGLNVTIMRINAALNTLLLLSGVKDNPNKHVQNWNNSWDLNANKRSVPDSYTKISNPQNSICYDNLGCIDKMKHSKLRGFYLEHESLTSIESKISIFNAENIKKGGAVLFVSNNLSSVGHLPETIKSPHSHWIVHGFTEHGERSWVKEMMERFIRKYPNRNVFVLNWYNGAKPPYSQAVANVEMVGAFLGYSIYRVQELLGLPASEAHCIGHSLGAHIVGMAGQWLQQTKGIKIKRISGLDPASPYFSGIPRDGRLDETDANFVDIIHTDAVPTLSGGSLVGFGMIEPTGHADFYPNGGKYQPGCENSIRSALDEAKNHTILDGLRRVVSCNHLRSVDYFAESISGDCKFPSFSHSSWEDFLHCNSSCVPPYSPGKSDVEMFNYMGQHSLKPENPSVYYSFTSYRKPFCQHHYLITISTMLPQNSIPSQLSVTIFLMNTQNEMLDHLEIHSMFVPLKTPFLKVVGTKMERFPDDTAYVVMKFKAITPIVSFLRQVLTTTDHPMLYIREVTLQSLENAASKASFCMTERDISLPTIYLWGKDPKVSLYRCPPPGNA